MGRLVQVERKIRDSWVLARLRLELRRLVEEELSDG